MNSRKLMSFAFVVAVELSTVWQELGQTTAGLKQFPLPQSGTYSIAVQKDGFKQVA